MKDCEEYEELLSKFREACAILDILGLKIYKMGQEIIIEVQNTRFESEHNSEAFHDLINHIDKLWIMMPPIKGSRAKRILF